MNCPECKANMEEYLDGSGKYCPECAEIDEYDGLSLYDLVDVRLNARGIYSPN